MMKTGILLVLVDLIYREHCTFFVLNKLRIYGKNYVYLLFYYYLYPISSQKKLYELVNNLCL